MLAKLPLVKLSIGSDHRSQKSAKHSLVPRRFRFGQWFRASPRFGAENTFTDVFDNTRDISDFKKQDRLNNYLLVYCHKSITDTLDTVKIACANEQRKWHFEKKFWKK